MSLAGRVCPPPPSPTCDCPAASQPARTQTIGVKTELNWASDAEMGQFSCQNCTAGQGTDSGHRQRWVLQNIGGGVTGCSDSGCFGGPAEARVGVLFGQWTPQFLFSRSTSPLSNTTRHNKTVQSRQLPPWVSISAACFCKPQFWRHRPPRPAFLSLECLTPSGPGTSW